MGGTPKRGGAGSRRLQRWPVVLLCSAVLVACGDGPSTRQVTDEWALAPDPERVATWSSPPESPTAPPERVVLIVLDTVRSDRLSSYGNAHRTTPHLDRLAARDAVRFERVYASSSWTLPSMTSIFTSLHPHQHGVEDRGTRLDPEVPTLAGAFAAQGWHTAGFVTHVYVTSLFGLHSGFAELHELSIDWEFREGFQIRADTLTERALAWLDAHRDERFFLYLHYFDPHWDYDPPGTYRRRFTDPAYAGEATGRWTHLRNFVGPALMAPADLAHTIALYDGELAYTDAALGTLFDQMRAMSLWDDSLVVIVSDHGEEFQDHGSVHHIRTLYDEVLRVPLLIKPAGGRAAQWRPRVPERVRTLDLAPTVLHMAGLRRPTEFRGESLVPLMQAPGTDRDVFARTQRHASDKVAYITGSLKLIRPFGRSAGDDELYDLATDPGERHSRAGEDQRRLAMMQHALDDFLRREPPRPTAGRRDVAVSDELSEHLRRLGYVE